jgi:hypothetical protein
MSFLAQRVLVNGVLLLALCVLLSVMHCVDVMLFIYLSMSII